MPSTHTDLIASQNLCFLLGTGLLFSTCSEIGIPLFTQVGYTMTKVETSLELPKPCTAKPSQLY